MVRCLYALIFPLLFPSVPCKCVTVDFVNENNVLSDRFAVRWPPYAFDVAIRKRGESGRIGQNIGSSLVQVKPRNNMVDVAVPISAYKRPMTILCGPWPQMLYSPRRRESVHLAMEMSDACDPHLAARPLQIARRVSLRANRTVSEAVLATGGLLVVMAQATARLRDPPGLYGSSDAEVQSLNVQACCPARALV